MATKRPTGKTTVKILLVDDHPIVREGLTAVLSSQSDFEVCGEAADMQQALRLVEKTRPDVAIIDLSLESGSGLELISRIRDRCPSTRMLVCSLYDEGLYAERALHAGAVGYVNKREATRAIVGAIRRVLEGKVYLSEEMTERLAHRLVGTGDRLDRPAVERLSNRELEIFQLVGEGRTTSEIAGRLKVGVKTIETHRQRIKAKLNLPNAAQLARAAAQWVLENG